MSFFQSNAEKFRDSSLSVQLAADKLEYQRVLHTLTCSRSPSLILKLRQMLIRTTTAAGQINSSLTLASIRLSNHYFNPSFEIRIFGFDSNNAFAA